MTSKFKNSCDARRKGLTLIEVLVGLLLLSTLLVGLVMGYGRHARQLRAAQQRLVAIDAADRLLADWLASPESLPRAASGLIAGTDSWTWDTRVVEHDLDETLEVQVVALEIRDALARYGDRPLVAVEVIVPVPRDVAPSGGARQ